MAATLSPPALFLPLLSLHAEKHAESDSIKRGQKYKEDHGVLLSPVTSRRAAQMDAPCRPQRVASHLAPVGGRILSLWSISDFRPGTGGKSPPPRHLTACRRRQSDRLQRLGSEF